MASYLRDRARKPGSPRAGSRSQRAEEAESPKRRGKATGTGETPPAVGVLGGYHASKGMRRVSPAERLSPRGKSGSWTLDASYPTRDSSFGAHTSRRSSSCRRASSQASGNCGPLPSVHAPLRPLFHHGSWLSSTPPPLSSTPLPHASRQPSPFRSSRQDTRIRDFSCRLGSMDIVDASSRSRLNGVKTGKSIVCGASKRAFFLGPGPGVCGLVNMGNSCYQNATMQILAGIPELVEFFRTSQDWKRRSQRSIEIGTTILQMWSTSPKDAMSLKAMIQQLGRTDDRWCSYSQEDAHEFLNAILGTLQDDCSRNTSRPAYRELADHPDLVKQAEDAWEYSRTWHNSVIDDIFGFQLHSQLTCPKCQHQSNTFDYACELELPIPDKEGGAVTLQDCLNQLVTPEMLSPENEWYCSNCQSHVLAKKKLSIYRTPPVLLVALKRFGIRNSCRFRAWKNSSTILMSTDKIEFSSGLSPLSSEKETCYDLCGIVDHAGTLTGGHYTARVKNAKTGHWYHFNDTQVREVPPPSGPGASGYTLVLRKCR